MEKSLFILPRPLPQGAVFIGPPDWIPASNNSPKLAYTFSDPVLALKWLTDSTHSTGETKSHLIILHQDVFAAQDGADNLVGWLEDLHALRAPFLPILLHGNLSADQLVRFFRAGLFDALSVPISNHDWVNMLIRAEKRLEFRHQSRLLLESTGKTTELMRSLRRQLGQEDANSTSELLRAQETLETANRQLNNDLDQLSLLYRFGRQLSAAKNWDQVLREILQNLADFVGAGGAALILRSAPGGTYSPRQTWHWDESSWDKVLVNLTDQVDDAVAESILAPGVFRIDSGENVSSGQGRRIIALPLIHHDIRLGYMLLLFADPEEREKASQRFLSFLQAVQVMLSEEVAGAQMLDRIREIGVFNARVLETVSSSIWVIDEIGRTVYCNRSGHQMLTGETTEGLPPEEFLFQLGRGRQEANDSSGESSLPELFLDARIRLSENSGPPLTFLRDGVNADYIGEGAVISTDGESTPISIQTATMPGRSHGETWLVVVAEDRREALKLETERLKNDRLEGLVEMSATLAHEIRNPLMGLSGQAELLADKLHPADVRARYIDVIIAEVERIENTISRMLNFTRPYEPARRLFSLRSLSLDTLDLVQTRADEKDIDLEIHLLPEGLALSEWDINIDGDQIKQVLINLLINAIDAAPEKGQVQLKLILSRRLELLDAVKGTRIFVPGITIEVSDNGPGFANADLNRLFRPFYTTKSSGTGLGLSISHKIVTAHQGEISAGREQEITVFRILLPRPESMPSDDSGKEMEAE